MYALIISDSNFYLPQHLLIDLADCRTEGRDRDRGIEVENREEILMLKVIVRLQSAAGHEGVGDAHGGGVSKLHSDVEVIILFEERIGNDVEHIPAVLIPVFVRKLCGDVLKLLLKSIFSRNTIIVLQHGRYSIVVRPAKLPQIHRARVLSCAGISHIKDVFQFGIISRRVYNSNTLGAATHIAPHALVPEVVFSAGSGIRSLGVNHDLLIIRVLVQPSGCL